jgi:hypothetical protein
VKENVREITKKTIDMNWDSELQRWKNKSEGGTRKLESPTMQLQGLMRRSASDVTHASFKSRGEKIGPLYMTHYGLPEGTGRRCLSY